MEVQMERFMDWIDDNYSDVEGSYGAALIRGLAREFWKGLRELGR